MSENAHVHEGPSYYTIFLTLIVLTGVTVGVAYINLGPTLGVVVALAIASCKASLVALYFMHLKFEVRPIFIIVGVPIVLSIIMILALMPDIGSGSH